MHGPVVCSCLDEFLFLAVQQNWAPGVPLPKCDFKGFSTLPRITLNDWFFFLAWKRSIFNISNINTKYWPFPIGIQKYQLSNTHKSKWDTTNQSCHPYYLNSILVQGPVGLKQPAFPLLPPQGMVWPVLRSLWKMRWKWLSPSYYCCDDPHPSFACLIVFQMLSGGWGRGWCVPCLKLITAIRNTKSCTHCSVGGCASQTEC